MGYLGLPGAQLHQLHVTLGQLFEISGASVSPIWKTGESGIEDEIVPKDLAALRKMIHLGLTFQDLIPLS